HVERAHGRDDDEVRQDERPSSGPGAPEAAPNVRDPDADLDRQRTRQRLADGDALAHLLFAEPPLVADQLALHLAHERDRTAEAKDTEAQIIPDELADRHAVRRLLRFHR